MGFLGGGLEDCWSLTACWSRKILVKFHGSRSLIFLCSSERLTVSNFLQSQCGVWISVSQSKDRKKARSRREKRWSCRLPKSCIYNSPPLLLADAWKVAQFVTVAACLSLHWMLSFATTEEARFADWSAGGPLEVSGWCCGCGTVDLFLCRRIS